MLSTQNENTDFFVEAIISIIVGLIAYNSALGSYFFWDDVDYFGGLCQAVVNDSIVDWLWVTHNGHLMPISKILYWLLDRFGERSALIWQIFNLFLHLINILCVLFILRTFIRFKYLAGFLTCLYASSPIYYENILYTNSMPPHLGISFALLCWVLTIIYIFRGNHYINGCSILFGICACFSSGFGLFAFLFQIFLWFALKPKRVIGIFQPVILSVGSFLFFGWMAKGQPGGTSFNLLFGLSETFRALFEQHFPNYVRILGWPLLVFSWFAAIRERKNVNWKAMLAAAFLIVIPLFTMLSFRSEFERPGNWSRYHHYTVIGTLLMIGVGRFDIFFQFITKKRVYKFILLIMILLYSMWSSFELNKKPKREKVVEYEKQLLQAIYDYGQNTGKEHYILPTLKTRLPEYPGKHKLSWVGCYLIPYDKRHFIHIKSDENEKFKVFLNNRDKYLMVRNYLQTP